MFCRNMVLPYFLRDVSLMMFKTTNCPLGVVTGAGEIFVSPQKFSVDADDLSMVQTACATVV